MTSRLLSDTFQDSLPQFGLVPTYQNAEARPFHLFLLPPHSTYCFLHEKLVNGLHHLLLLSVLCVLLGGSSVFLCSALIEGERILPR